MIRKQEFAIESKVVHDKRDAEIFSTRVHELLANRWRLHGTGSAILQSDGSLYIMQTLTRETFG